MSGSETAVNVMTPQPPATIQNMRLAFSADGTAVYKPITATSPTYQPSSGGGDAAFGGGATAQGLNMNMGSGSGSGSEQMKRKRGRPRKYGPDGTMSLALVPSPTSVTTAGNQSGGGLAGGGSGLSSPSGGPLSPDSMKKSRGRPPGSGKKHQLESLGLAGVGFTPHVLTVKAGEDVSSKIMSFSQNGPRAVCILSANGAISNVTLRQAATSGGTVTYEGRFEILSLSGSFLLSEISGQRSRTGGLSVSLSGPDGRVLGGSVAGLLTAASPVQVVVGSFLADGRKESKSSHRMESLPAPPKLTLGAQPAGQNSPPSRGTLSESSGGAGSPLNHSTGACNNNHPHGMATSIPWK